MCHKIFVLNNDEQDSLSLRGLFENAGYDVETFYSIKGLEAGIQRYGTPDVLAISQTINGKSCIPILNKYRYEIPYMLCTTEQYERADRLTSFYSAGATDVQPKQSKLGLRLSVTTMMARTSKGKHTETLTELDGFADVM